MSEAKDKRIVELKSEVKSLDDEVRRTQLLLAYVLREVGPLEILKEILDEALPKDGGINIEDRGNTFYFEFVDMTKA